MLFSKEKLEDIKWLEECYGMLAEDIRQLNNEWRTVHDPLTPEEVAKWEGHKAVMEKEIETIKHKLETHDYEPLELRRQMSIRRLGKDSIYY